MEDIQFSASAAEQMETAAELTDQGFMPVDVLESASIIDNPVVEEPETVPEAVVTKVEEVTMPEPMLEPEEPILPDHYYDDGNIPVFKPTMDQFKDFEKFITRINDYGMKAGIVKVIPPPEWRETLPPLDDKVKGIKLKNAIEQQFAGSGGIFRQTNLEKRRVYNLPHWREVCESTDHQPPARRGEVRMAGHTVGKRKAKPKKSTRKKAKRTKKADALKAPNGNRTSSSAVTKPLVQEEKACEHCWTTQAPLWRKSTSGGDLCNACGLYQYKRGFPRPVTRPENRPTCLDKPKTETPLQIPSPEHSSAEDQFSQAPNVPVPTSESSAHVDVAGAIEMDVDQPIAEPIIRPNTPDSPPTLKRKRTPSIASVESDVEAEDDDDEDSDFQNFNYRISNASEYTVERCKDLERIYWKTVTFNSPMYGADMPGSLFDDRTETWNVAKLDNLLCRIGKTIPGVNSAYLYLGMWKATFSWHVEDMDLYSINYIHFGAPKQWYSINQADGEKFESVMRSHFPNDHKGCPQFMRHKTFLASPSALENKGIKVNRLVHHEGEFVITFPFGYHSGYNLGYNCAESVNFATDYWLDIGRQARKCNCAEDSVNINVDDIIDAIRGGPKEEDFDEDAPLTPPDSLGVAEETKKKKKERKVKTEGAEKKFTPKKDKRPHAPCMLCPNDPSREPLLPAESGKNAHRICAEYIPETWILSSEDGHEVVAGTERITPARWNLKCLYCGSTRGAKFQCSVTQCCRAYHATCAAAAGVLVETAEDEQGFVSSYQCRFHRPKRIPAAYLEDDANIAEFASKLQQGETIQAKFAGMENDVPFVGVVVENCESEKMVVIELSNGELFEVAYKWILAPPKRDVRALCANQSVPGSTKQRTKKKKPNPAEAAEPAPLSVDSAQQCDSQTVNIPQPATPFVLIPPHQPVAGQSATTWSARNPALAQYHQYVWQIQQQNPKSVSSDDAFSTIMQRLQATPSQTSPQLHVDQTSPVVVHRQEIVLPPPQFNLGQPPPTLLPAAQRDVPFVPQPSYTGQLQQPTPPPSQTSPTLYRPALSNEQPQVMGFSQPQQWPPQWQQPSYTSQQWNGSASQSSPSQFPSHPRQPELKPLHPRPPAPNMSAQQISPAQPEMHNRMMPSQNDQQNSYTGQ